MKELLACILLFLFFAQSALAQGSSDNLSLSDIVYADLATRHYLDNVSIYYTNGKFTDDIQLSEGRHWLPASTVKTFAAMYTFKRISEHKLSLKDTFIIEPKNSVPTELVTLELPTLLEGSSVTLDRLIKQMIIQSDNTAFNVLLDVLGRDNITKYIQSFGLNHSNVGSKLNLDTSQEQYEFDAKGYGINTTTAEDYAKAFLLIKNNKIPGAKELLTILKNQKLNNMIPLLLPKEVICAHKTGDLNPLYHDGGICQDKNQAYVLTIFTNAGDTDLVAHLSKLIYTRDLNLVGQSLEKKSIVGETQTTQPLDQLVFSTPPSSSSVLGASTTDFPSQAITASDLGVSAKDLSLIIKDKDLPHVSIPADSPFHILTDFWQAIQKATVFGPETRRVVDLGIIRLDIAEAKDLIKRGKKKEADAALQKMQREIILSVKDNAIANDSSAQNAIQAASETRFAILTDELKNAKKDQKIAIIKEIANQAKSTVQNVQPNITNATNATNPSQKPFIGEVVKTTPTQVTVKTSGGQELTIATNNTSVTIQEKQSIVEPSSLITPTPSISPSLKSLSVGTTVALFGSTVNNTFSPTLILTKIPKELAAPQPVTVLKVDTKNNTMVVDENGIYTQVNINKNTSIKGTDTDIPLKEIKEGDVVMIHGRPLIQAQPEPAKPSTTPSPTQKLIPTKKENTSSQQAPGVSVSPSPATIHTSPSVNIPNNNNPHTQNAIPTSSALPTTNQKQNPSTQSTPQTPKASAPSVPTSTKSNPSPVNQPRVIEGTSIRVLEKKQDVQASTPSQRSQSPEKPAPQILKNVFKNT